jgi:hypothetical protein
MITSLSKAWESDASNCSAHHRTRALLPLVLAMAALLVDATMANR